MLRSTQVATVKAQISAHDYHKVPTFLENPASFSVEMGPDITEKFDQLVKFEVDKNPRTDQ